MNMDTNKKYLLPRAIILAACPLLLAGACDNYAYDGMEPDTPGKEVPLRFNASIEKTEVAQSRAIIPTTDFTGNSYSFGMSITKSENGNEIFKGSSDMTATMERPNSSAQWNWSFVDNSGQSTVTPAGPEGKALKVVAYYPCVPSGTKSAYTNGIPFDFSSKTNLKQTDLLFNTNTTYPFNPSGEPVATIPLHFRHAYTWIVLNITKYVDKGGDFKLSSVSLDNLGGGWIKNKGAIDPLTGLAKEGAAAGPIGVTLDPAVSLSTANVLTYEFLVPSFMDAKVGDGEIVLVLKVNGINELFVLDKDYLNRSEDGKSFGFRQGYKNTYDLVYNNSALSMTIKNWTSEVITGDFGVGTADPPEDDFRKVNIQSPPYWPSAGGGPYPPPPTYLHVEEHLFESYLTTVAYGANGAYIPVNTPTGARPQGGMDVIDDINVRKNEKAYPIIEVTKNNVSLLPVPWEDGKGELVAKELCRQYTGGGKHDWRLPRASELRTLFIVVAGNTQYNNLNFKTDENQNRVYWTGTEVNEGKAWGIYFYWGGMIKDSRLVLSAYDKGMEASVRCVREAGDDEVKPKYK